MRSAVRSLSPRFTLGTHAAAGHLEIPHESVTR